MEALWGFMFSLSGFHVFPIVVFDSFGDHQRGRFGDVSVMTFVDVFGDQGPNVGLPRN